MRFDVGVELLARQTTEVLGGEHRVVHKRHSPSARSTPSCGGMLMNRPSIAQPDTSLITSAKLWISCWLLGQVRQTTTPGGLLPPTPRTVRQDPRSSGDVFVVELARHWRHQARGKVSFVFVVGAGVRCSCVHPTTQAHAAFSLFTTLKGTLWGHVIIGNI